MWISFGYYSAVSAFHWQTWISVATPDSKAKIILVKLQIKPLPTRKMLLLKFCSSPALRQMWDSYFSLTLSYVYISIFCIYIVCCRQNAGVKLQFKADLCGPSAQLSSKVREMWFDFTQWTVCMLCICCVLMLLHKKIWKWFHGICYLTSWTECQIITNMFTYSREQTDQTHFMWQQLLLWYDQISHIHICLFNSCTQPLVT